MCHLDIPLKVCRYKDKEGDPPCNTEVRGREVFKQCYKKTMMERLGKRMAATMGHVCMAGEFIPLEEKFIVTYGNGAKCQFKANSKDPNKWLPYSYRDDSVRDMYQR